MSTPRSLRKPLSFLVAILLLAFSFTALAAAEGAAAHDSLLSSSPANGETVTDELTEITLNFSNTPMAGVDHIIQVTDPTGTIVSSGETVISGNDLTTDMVPTMEGVHEVAWQAVSVDGHTISGEFTFTYAGPLAAATPSATPDASTPAPDPAPAESNADENGSEGETGAGPIWAALAGLLIVLVIVAGVILRRVSKKSSAEL